ncbi:MAG: gfo/Idh/MocA family oxidoreductase [Lysobacter sp.]|nr:gfo/Idh/MocA family oxidoreductase [Lysobacter sp.]
MNRRDFLATSATASTLLASSAFTPAFARTRSKLRIGLIGVGMRGQVHLTELLRREDVEVTALCDVEPIMLDRSLAMIAKAGKAKPATYGADGDLDAYRAMLAKGGTPYMLLENVCYRRDVLAALNMVRQGLFGEIVHLQGGYQHDLRGVKFNSGNPDQPYGSGVEFGPKAWSEARWRTEHSVKRDGDLYPSHGIGPCAMAIDIHRGNRFTHLSAFSSKPRGLHDYIVKKAGPDHPNAKVKFKLGDLVTTQLLCENGETIVLQHDTSLPRPYSLGFRVQGTDGLWMDVNDSIHIEGKSQPHKWDKADDWFAKYDHPLWQRFASAAADAGHGGMDFFVIHAFVEALKADAPMPIDIFDAIAWSAITPLSEQSIAEHKTLEFPDFTNGKWKDRKPIFALNDRY